MVANFCFCNPTTLPPVPIPPGNTLCEKCYLDAKNLIVFVDNLSKNNDPLSSASVLSQSIYKGLGGALRWMKERKEKEEELSEKLEFLGGFVAAFKEGIHSDIQVKPGNGPSLLAHRALLATRSVIFKNMLESDECKAAPNDTISIPELNPEELESLLEFLYSGNLATEKVKNHVFSLLIAADKYEISFLQKFCEHQMLESLDSSNALTVLEISVVCSNNTLKEAAMKSVVKHMKDILFSPGYAEFARKNPQLSLEITKNLFLLFGKNGV